MKKIHSSLLPAVAVGIASILSAGVAFADDVFVSNNENDSIEEIVNGTPTTFIGTTNDLADPTGLATYGNNLFVANSTTGDVAEFSLSNGAFEGNYATGLANPRGIVFDSAGDLFVADQGSGSVTMIPAGSAFGSTGSTFVSGFTAPNGLAIYNGSLYIADGGGANTVNEVSLVTRATVSPPLISGVTNPNGLAVYDGSLFEVNNGTDQILAFNPTSGASDGAAVTDTTNMLNSKGLAIDSMGDFYVTDEGDNTVTEYNPAGKLIGVYNTGFYGPNYVTTDLLAAPEPSACALLVAGLAMLFVVSRRKRAMALNF
jgi:sugar lactone lactonase YvrE